MPKRIDKRGALDMKKTASYTLARQINKQVSTTTPYAQYNFNTALIQISGPETAPAKAPSP